MRPHITQREARYLVELLQSSLDICSSLEVYFKELDREVFKLNELRRLQPYEAFAKGLTGKKGELEKWGERKWGLGWSVFTNKPLMESLILKYSNIANGEKHRGVYKRLNTRLGNQIGLIDKGSLKEVLEKELKPIETLGVKA